MDNFNYTDKMYEEDRKLANYFFNKKYLWLSHMREDIISMLIFQLYKYRPQYDPSKSTYATYAGMIIKCRISNIMKKKNLKQNEFENNSLDQPDKCGLTLLSKLSDDDKSVFTHKDTYNLGDTNFLIKQVYALTTRQSKSSGKPINPKITHKSSTYSYKVIPAT